MQFQVPQFIDVSPKIVGPLTLKQFLYLAAALVPSFLLFFVLQFWLWLIIAAVLVLSGAALAFLKYNGQPLPKIMTSAFNYFWQPRFYLWRRIEEPIKTPNMPKLKETSERSPIKDLLLKITTYTHPIEKREKPSLRLPSFRQQKDVFETLRKTAGDRTAAKRVDYR